MKSLVTGVLVLSLFVIGTASVRADAVYHTERLTLDAVDDNVPGTGMVVNIHPNGPTVYAHEIYSLKGTLPNAGYVVRLWVHPFDTSCESEGVNFASTPLRTNRAGNGHADLFIRPDQVPGGLRDNQAHGVRWDVTTLNGVPQYETRCTIVTLD